MYSNIQYEESEINLFVKKSTFIKMGSDSQQ